VETVAKNCSKKKREGERRGGEEAGGMLRR